MKIRLNVDYNEDHKKGSDGEGLPDDLKRRLVKSGLAEKVVSPSAKASATAAPAKPKRAKGRTAARLAAATPEGHRPLAGPAPDATPAPASEAAEK